MVTLGGHIHTVGRNSYYRGLKCDACDRSFDRRGYHCLKCDFYIHTKCAFVFASQETLAEHPSHVGHSLMLLTTGAPGHTDLKCHICGKNTKRLLYHCSICNLNLDIDCMVDAMCSRASLYMSWHYHPLLMLDVGDHMLCAICGLPGEYGYCCPRCRMVVHEKCACVFDSPDITHPLHAKHPLNLLTHGAPDYTESECHVCGKHTENFLYHCDICKFNLDMVCAIEHHGQHKVIPVSLSNMKVHEHTLTLVSKLISFVCDACGMKGEHSPYVCLQCNLMFFHQDCARLPRVIHVNRHDHRVSYKYPLGRGKWKCGVCLEVIDWSYGAYSCSLCPNYTIHPRCATRRDVWDEKELDGVSEEEVENTEPFKMNNDGTITHFTHEHNMSHNKDGIALEESVLCGACVSPIGSYTFYNCSDCSFILHETCANLPKKKRHFLSPRPLTLCLNRNNSDTTCGACLQMCCEGFMYSDGYQMFDLLCSSITVPFIHESHPHHPLLYHNNRNDYGGSKKCQSCGIGGYDYVLGCIKCNYFLHFRCATLPLKVKVLRYDDHPLTLCYGEKAKGRYWCDICEGETNPEKWFYTSDCGVTLHVFCVLGNVRYPKQGGKINGGVELKLNNTSSRPLCNNCHFRCAAPFFLIKGNELFCSYYCLLRIQTRASSISTIVIRPPWVVRLDNGNT